MPVSSQNKANVLDLLDDSFLGAMKCSEIFRSLKCFIFRILDMKSSLQPFNSVFHCLHLALLLIFLDGYSSELQAQRDYYGAHCYQLLSNPGIALHTNWTGKGRRITSNAYSA
uniref:Phosphogluconate dehydrogenase (NADP(+)-dependent, decarboxylating) n=1 Tax=Meloidogyne floridensis TaxID=298350 RepID=A0A915P4Y1_9BILA